METKFVFFLKNNWHYILYTIVVLFIYEGVFYFDFVNFDDYLQVTDNVRVQSLSFPNIKTIFTTATVNMYQPLTSLVLAILFYFADFTAGYYHVFSLCIHLLNGFLVFGIVNKLFASKKISGFITLFFLVHPIMIESVLWVSATSTILYVFFFLAATLSYLEYQKSNKNSQYFLTLLFFILGLLCKIQMITFIGVLFLIDWFFKQKIFAFKELLKKIPFLFIAIVFTVIAFHFRNTTQDVLQGINYHLIGFIPSQLIWYISKYIAPFSLSVIYDWPTVFGLKESLFSIFFLLLLGLVFVFRKNKLAVFGFAFYLITLIVHTTLVIRFFSPYGDRYGYLPYLGFLIFVFALVSKFKKQQITLLSFVFLLFFGYLSKKQVKVWENSETLWTNNLKSQKTVIANMNRASYFINQKQYNKALIDVKIILKSKDRTLTITEKVDAYYDLGVIYYDKKQLKKSEKSYLKAIELGAKNYKSFYNLGNLYTGEQKYNSAIDLYTKALEIAPNFNSLYKNRANSYFQIKQFEKALLDVNKAIALDKKKTTIQTRDGSLIEFKKAILKNIKTK